MVIGWGEFNTFVIVSCRAWASTAGMSFVFNFSSFLIGLIIYAAFRYCDPIKDGVIFSKDQVIRYHSYSQVHPLNCTKAIKCDESAWLLVSVNWERIVRKTCRRWTLRGIMPTLRLIFRMAPVRQLASYCDLAANNKYASSSQLDPRSLKGKETFEAVFCFVFS